ncbi:MAG: phasin family protein [Alphaproteobacteria bacterium]|nr:phasin family protein [Alphaproteobacteria bacterium]
MKHQKSTHAPNDPLGGNPFQSALNAPVVEAMGHGAAVLGRSATTLQQEGMRFITRRVEQNMKAVEQFGACKTLPELFAAQQYWLADMTRAYSEEWARCGELMTELLHERKEEAGNGDGPKQNEPTRETHSRQH